ncbi:MAG: thiamine-monophosphate kinase [Phycisphaerae bacterium]
MNERDLIRSLKSLFAPVDRNGDFAVPFGDDMASVPQSQKLIWTTDMLLDGVHFDSKKHDCFLIGRKAMAVNLSDCGAMGATPRGALCALAASAEMTERQILRLHEGAQEIGVQYGCPITGGDSNRWQEPTVFTITVIAEVGGYGPVRRDGAKVGDTLWVSGPLGGSILGRHLTFTPRVELGLRLAGPSRADAMMDISDGLAIDLSRMMEASGCGAVLERDALETIIHDDARELSQEDGVAALDHALYDGEDFELLVALPSNADMDQFTMLGLTRIGTVVDAERGIQISDGKHSTPLPIRGWDHFE